MIAKKKTVFYDAVLPIIENSKRLNMKIRLAVALVFLFILGCGSDSGGKLDGKYSVTDVNVLAFNIQRGEQVRAEIFFETKTEPDGYPDGLDVIVRIPPELVYAEGSSNL